MFFIYHLGFLFIFILLCIALFFLSTLFKLRFLVHLIKIRSGSGDMLPDIFRVIYHFRIIYHNQSYLSLICHLSFVKGSISLLTLTRYTAASVNTVTSYRLCDCQFLNILCTSK